MRICCWIAAIVLLPTAVLAEGLDLLPYTKGSLTPRTAQETFTDPAPTPTTPPGQNADVSTVITPQTGEIDLRPPSIRLGEIGLEEEPKWINSFIDDHLLIWDEVPSGLENVPRAGTEFGMTTLGTKFDIVGNGPMWIGGSFGWNFLSGPTTADVPAQTYDLGLELNYARKLNDSWGIHLNANPLWATDFSNVTSDAFRLLAGGLLTFQADEVTKLVAGISYLDRPDLNFLPIAGLKWMVTEDLALDILVPRPRIAWRIKKEADEEQWLFLAGEVGGGSWAIERDPHLADRMGYQDLRWTGGIEYRQPSGSRGVLEAGYVFNRKIEFERGGGDVDPGNTFVIRWGQLY